MVTNDGPVDPTYLSWDALIEIIYYLMRYTHGARPQSMDEGMWRIHVQKAEWQISLGISELMRRDRLLTSHEHVSRIATRVTTDHGITSHWERWEVTQNG